MRDGKENQHHHAVRAASSEGLSILQLSLILRWSGIATRFEQEPQPSEEGSDTANQPGFASGQYPASPDPSWDRQYPAWPIPSWGPYLK